MRVHDFNYIMLAKLFEKQNIFSKLMAVETGN